MKKFVKRIIIREIVAKMNILLGNVVNLKKTKKKKIITTKCEQKIWFEISELDVDEFLQV